MPIKLAQSIDLTAQVGVDVFTFAPQIKICRDIVPATRQIGIGGERMLQALLLAHHLLGFLRIRPQVRVGGLLLNFG